MIICAHSSADKSQRVLSVRSGVQIPLGVHNMDTNIKGEIALLKVQERALEKGILISVPIRHSSRYDVVLDEQGILKRAQVKYCNGKSRVASGCVRLGLQKRLWGKGWNRRCYTRDEIDLILVYIPEVNKIVALKPELFEGKTAVNIRLEKPKNGQKKGIIALEKNLW